jgi:hypothetical protein
MRTPLHCGHDSGTEAGASGGGVARLETTGLRGRATAASRVVTIVPELCGHCGPPLGSNPRHDCRSTYLSYRGSSAPGVTIGRLRPPVVGVARPTTLLLIAVTPIAEEPTCCWPIEAVEPCGRAAGAILRPGLRMSRALGREPTWRAVSKTTQPVEKSPATRSGLIVRIDQVSAAYSPRQWNVGMAASGNRQPTSGRLFSTG